MDVISSRRPFRQALDQARTEGKTVGLVPTMGDLHRGHASLIERARRECGFVAVSVFVNPLQFDSKADLDAYPRRLANDRATAEALGCDAVFAPDEAEMYPQGRPEVTVDPGPLGERLEGASRPGHFRGVLTVVAKLFDLAGSCRGYFGEKDAQQLELVRRMAAELDMAVEVIPCPTVREPDGLAISSRNRRLSAEERRAAPVLFDALSAAAGLVRHGERRADVLRAEMARRIGSEPLARVDYVAVVDDQSWEDARDLKGAARALVAMRLGGTRLIDNLALPAVGPVQNMVESSGGSRGER
jgi:pantoate--beta-alanine ligase